MIRKTTRRGETRLVVDISYTKKDGTPGRYRKDAQVQTMAAARAEERRLLGLIAQYGEPYEPRVEAPPEPSKCITFEEAAKAFKKGKAVTELKPSTKKTYEDVLDARLVPKFGKLRLDEIDHEKATKLDAELVEEGLSPSTRRNVLIVLRSVLGAAHEAGQLQALPKLPKLPKVGRTILKTLTREQVQAILDAAGPAARLAFALSAYAGLRSGEVKGLRWSDLDLQRGVLVVRRAICKGIEATPKSGHQRKVPIAAPLRLLLDVAPPHSPWGPVAPTAGGQVWSDSALGKAFTRAMKKAGLSGWRPHDMRHFFTSQCFRSGTPAPVVQALVGHGSLAVTQIYAHTNEEDLHKAIQRLGNSLETDKVDAGSTDKKAS